MSEEQSGNSTLKNAIIGLITIIITAVAGVIGKKMMGEDAPVATVVAPAPAVVPNIIINNNTQSGPVRDIIRGKVQEKKDDWTKKAPKW